MPSLGRGRQSLAENSRCPTRVFFPEKVPHPIPVSRQLAHPAVSSEKKTPHPISVSSQHPAVSSLCPPPSPGGGGVPPMLQDQGVHTDAVLLLAYPSGPPGAVVIGPILGSSSSPIWPRNFHSPFLSFTECRSMTSLVQLYHMVDFLCGSENKNSTILSSVAALPYASDRPTVRVCVWGGGECLGPLPAPCLPPRVSGCDPTHDFKERLSLVHGSLPLVGNQASF